MSLQLIRVRHKKPVLLPNMKYNLTKSSEIEVQNCVNTGRIYPFLSCVNEAVFINTLYVHLNYSQYGTPREGGSYIFHVKIIYDIPCLSSKSQVLTNMLGCSIPEYCVSLLTI